MDQAENISGRYPPYQQKRSGERPERGKRKRLYCQLINTEQGNGKEGKRQQAAGYPGMYRA